MASARPTLAGATGPIEGPVAGRDPAAGLRRHPAAKLPLLAGPPTVLCILRALRLLPLLILLLWAAEGGGGARQQGEGTAAGMPPVTALPSVRSPSVATPGVRPDTGAWETAHVGGSPSAHGVPGG